MTDWETAPDSTHDTSPAIGERADPDHAERNEDTALLELHGTFYAPVDINELSIEAKASAAAVIPIRVLGEFIKKRQKALNEDAARASQKPLTMMSTSKERIDYASSMSLIGGEKLGLRGLLEFLLDTSTSSQFHIEDAQDPSAD